MIRAALLPDFHKDPTGHFAGESRAAPCTGAISTVRVDAAGYRTIITKPVL